ncbi:MAG: penicillin-binding protein activator [Alphaproteobacteria bacterium]|nr:penicillin-binding protein activator [Alphaproteobacteria bacterium]
MPSLTQRYLGPAALAVILLAACSGTSSKKAVAEQVDSTYAVAPVAEIRSRPIFQNVAEPSAALRRFSNGTIGSETTPQNASGPAVKIGLLLPMDGPSAVLGEAMLDAAVLAMNDLYLAMPEARRASARIVLVPKSAGQDASSAARAAKEAIQDGAHILLGPVFSQGVSAAAHEAKSRRVPMLAFSNNAAVAGNGVYLLGFLPEQQIARIVSFAQSQGKRRIAALLPDDDYGKSIHAELRRQLSGGRADLTSVAFYSAGDDDLSPQLATLMGRPALRLPPPGKTPDPRSKLATLWSEDKVREHRAQPLPFDALLIPQGGEALARLAKQLPAYGIDASRVMILGSGQWDDPQTASLPALEGAYFAGSTPQKRDQFEMRFRSHFGYAPPRIASLAYDAAALAVSLGLTPGAADYSARALTDAAGFNGPADGIFRLMPDGANERGLAVLKVTPRGFAVVEAAPTTFGR